VHQADHNIMKRIATSPSTCTSNGRPQDRQVSPFLGRRVLLVEDEVAVREMLRLYLGLAGFESEAMRPASA
jgi:hypothetical protein